MKVLQQIDNTEMFVVLAQNSCKAREPYLCVHAYVTLVGRSLTARFHIRSYLKGSSANLIVDLYV